MMNKFNEAPIFVCGHPKSGTSLVLNLLDSHPQLVVFPEETSYFRHFLPLLQDISDEEVQEFAVNYLTRFFEWNLENPPEHQAGFPSHDYSFVDDQEVKTRMRAILAEGIKHPGSYLTAAARAMAETLKITELDEKRFVEKTPYNERYAPLIYTYWPGALCMHVIRDPNDNYASYKRKQSHWKPGFFANSWVRSTAKGFTNQKKYGKDRYLILRYEDLVQNLDDVLMKVCDFLQIRYNESLKLPTKLGKLWRGNSMFNDRFDAVSESPVGRWEKELTTSEAAQVQWVGRKYIRRLGYADNTPKSLSDILEGTKWQVRAALYSLRHTDPREKR